MDTESFKLICIVSCFSSTMKQKHISLSKELILRNLKHTSKKNHIKKPISKKPIEKKTHRRFPYSEWAVREKIIATQKIFYLRHFSIDVHSRLFTGKISHIMFLC